MANMTSESRNSTVFKSLQQSITATCLIYNEMYGQEIGIIAAYSHQHAFDSNLQEIRKSLR